jgi:LacI family transcriptional regulator
MKVKDAGVECVIVENQSPLCTCVNYDNFEGGRLAARYFLDKGFDDFGVLCEPFHWEYTVYSMQDRIMGFQAEVGAAGFSIPRENFFENQIDYHLVRRQFHDVFQSGKYPKAFFVPADLMAFGMVQAAVDCGLTPGKDVSVIGFDDIDYADVFELTTVSQHLDESGEIAVKALMEKLRDPEQPDQQIMMTLSLIRRKSA